MPIHRWTDDEMFVLGTIVVEMMHESKGSRTRWRPEWQIGWQIVAWRFAHWNEQAKQPEVKLENMTQKKLEAKFFELRAKVVKALESSSTQSIEQKRWYAPIRQYVDEMQRDKDDHAAVIKRLKRTFSELKTEQDLNDHILGLLQDETDRDNDDVRFETSWLRSAFHKRRKLQEEQLEESSSDDRRRGARGEEKEAGIR
eukprot:TRINITY_DN8580_c0_g1_i1.p1 TRINITY_DN8580_c0_g1~~TRINITY_DN8580_c0_g1_i1.p1  ORF type:complete len:199 (+),score=25.10 TRINITY_DN8580_c0_g1_i1:262-858(+)